MISTVFLRSLRVRDMTRLADISVAGVSTKSSSYLTKLCRPFSAGSENIPVGIDLGTTNSRVAVMEGKNVKVIENSRGAQTTPSVVPFDPKTWFSQPSALWAWLSTIVRDISGQAYSRQEIGGSVLKEMKESAEAYLGKAVSRAVITVPASFDHAQRYETVLAAWCLGIRTHCLIDGPTAAALSHATDIDKKSGLMVVFDLGGGTFDVSIFEISNGQLKLRATKGDALLGGGVFDRAVVEFLLSEFKRREGVDLSTEKRALRGLAEAAEQAKIRLSSATQTDINFTTPGGKRLSMTLTRSKFESLVGSLIEVTKNLCRSCVEDAEISIEDLDEVLLVGGMTRVPIVEEVVSELFGKSPSRAVNGDEAVVMGAAIQARILFDPKGKDDYTLKLWPPPKLVAPGPPRISGLPLYGPSAKTLFPKEIERIQK